MPTHNHETTTPSAADALQARETLRRLSHYPLAGDSALRIHVQGDEQTSEDVSLPVSAFRLLKDILAEMAQGNAVTLLPVRAELTTQQAADILNVSRPFLIGLLEEGKIPFRLVGQHRRVRLDDLTADAQELGMGY
jgi:excisionase family DNA binding protein